MGRNIAQQEAEALVDLLKTGKLEKDVLTNNYPDYTGDLEQRAVSLFKLYLNTLAFTINKEALQAEHNYEI